MDAVDKFELARHGVYPIAFDRRWHCGMHLSPTDQTEPVRAIADGEVVAYRVSQKAISDGELDANGNPELNSNNGFVLLKHKTDTGEGRTITFYSLYMHLLDINAQQIIAPQPITPPTTGSASALPGWLLHPTDGVKVGGNKKVYRKDMLGYWGHCHGQPHLHFEIFMTEAGFRDYFGPTQLGNITPTTPRSTDYWGHSYFVIPGGHTFRRVPPGQTDSPYFPALTEGTLGARSKLYVEAYFHKGQRYTRSWLENEDGLTLLTTSPVMDSCPDYEYDLFERATALYAACPSAGYELLRFGRALSTELPPLSATESQTWVAFTYNATGAKGYVDVGSGAITKLSDADFPFFAGWQKIEEANTPFDKDGLCDYNELRKLVDDVEATETSTQRREPAHKHEDRLAAYVQGNDAVRSKLKGFVCHAPSEWDGSGNDARYSRLKNPDGFFGKRRNFDPHGYERFIDFQKKLQFLEQTPLGGGKKFWFFHPLGFIRHFRKCGWLNQSELASTLPKYMFYTSTGNPRTAITSPANVYELTRVDAENRISGYSIALNKCLRKYIGSNKQRAAIFLAQVLLETAQWRNLGGMRRLMHEWYFGQYSSANPATRYYGAFYGRGIMQLTWAGTYAEYGNYSKLQSFNGHYVERLTPASPRITRTSQHYSANPSDRGVLMTWAPRYDPDIIGENPYFACDSGGFYWVSKHHSGVININRVVDKEYSATNVGIINRLVNGGGNGYYERQAYTVFALNKLTDDVSNRFSQIITPPTPKARVAPNMDNAG